MSTTTPTTPSTPPYDTVRGSAVTILSEYTPGHGSDLEDIIDKYAATLTIIGRDYRFLRRLVNGATKMRRRLDYELRFYLARPSEKLPDKLHNILRLGLYQLRYTDKVPAAAAVDESVKLAHYFYDNSRARLVNAILRTALREPHKVAFGDLERDPAKYLANFHSYPDYFVSYCLKEFGVSKTTELLVYMNEPPTLTIRVNLLRAKNAEVEEFLTQAEIQFHKGEFLEEFYSLEDGAIQPLKPLLDDGKIYIQDQSAGMAVRLLNPRPDMTVLDMAAAPGGKTTYCASRMRGKGRITAVDKSRKRLEILIQNASRMGIKIISPVVADASEFTTAELFERVLVDPPCSGWGTAGKHSDLRWEKTEEDIEQMRKFQRKMLTKGSELVKPGGVLVYSTCSLVRSENDQIVEEFLVKHKDFSLESASEFWDSAVVSERGFVKTYPVVRPLDGAFAARLKRRPN